MIDFGQRESGEVAKMSPNEFIRKALQEAGEDVLREEIEAGEVDGENKPIETFENGQPVAPAEQEVPQVKVEEPEIVPADDLTAETSSGGEAPAVPEEVAKADEQIEEAVEGELQAEGADVGEIEPEVGETTELPVGQDAVALSHKTFTRAKGEADADTAASLEARIVGGEPSGENNAVSEGWKPPTTEEEEDQQDMADMAALLRVKEQKAMDKGDTAGAEKAARQAEAAERASGGRALDPETSRDIKDLRAMMEIKAAKRSAENNSELGERGVLLRDLTTKVRELGGEPEYIIPEEILSYGSELGKIKYDDMTDQQKADSELIRAAAANILRDWIKDHENAPAVKGPEQKVEQPAATGEMKIVEKEIIGKATIEIPSGEEWHVDVVGKSTITINNNAKLVVSDVAGKNKFIIIGNGQLEIKGVDDKNEIVRK